MSNSKIPNLKTLRHICKFFDLYGQNVNLFFDKKPRYYTTCSGLISMAVIVIIIYTFGEFIQSWLNKEKITFIPSTINYSVIELLAKNQNYEYKFNYQNYYIYWVISASLPNGSSFGTNDLKNYFTYKISYLSEFLDEKELIAEPCKADQQDAFLGLDDETINGDVGKIGKDRICIKDGFKMGIFPDNNISTVNVPIFHFIVYQCVNSTNNNNSCAPQEEIDEMIKYAYVQTSLPLTVYDFNDVKKPHKNIYDYRYTNLDKSMCKYYYNLLIPSLLYIDYGLISDDYQLQSTNFNPSINYDPSFRQPDDPLFMFDFQMGFSFQIYYLRNLKVNELIGNLGGLINAIFLIGKVICVTYNSLHLKFKLINSTFSHTLMKKNGEIFPKTIVGEMRNNRSLKESIISKLSRKISYCSCLFPSKELRLFYQRGFQHLHQYLDIRKIIERLQDIDKLKLVLLNEDQRKLFECIPKPDVVHSLNKLSQESLRKDYKKEKTQKTTRNLTNNLKSMADDNDPIKKRIIEFLDPIILFPNNAENNDIIKSPKHKKMEFNQLSSH